MAKGQALGMIETFGLAALIAAADTAAKTSSVHIYTYEKADAGILTVYLYGDVSSVMEAVSAGAEKARTMGKLLHFRVIPSPAIDFTEWIRKKQRKSDAEQDALAMESFDQLSLTELRKRVKEMPGQSLARTVINKADRDTLLHWLAEKSAKGEG